MAGQKLEGHLPCAVSKPAQDDARADGNAQHPPDKAGSQSAVPPEQTPQAAGQDSPSPTKQPGQLRC